MKELKRCTVCNEVKHIFNFWKNPKDKTKRLNQCTTCVNEQRRTRHARPPRDKESNDKEVYNLNGDAEIYC